MQRLCRKIIALFHTILNRISIVTLIALFVVICSCRNVTSNSDVFSDRDGSAGDRNGNGGDRNGNGGDRNGNGDLTGLSSSNSSSLGAIKIVDANATAQEIKDEWHRRAQIVLEKSREYIRDHFENSSQLEKDLVKKNGFWRKSEETNYESILSPVEHYNLMDLPVNSIPDLRDKNPDCEYWNSNSPKPSTESPSDFFCRLEESVDPAGIDIEIDLHTTPPEPAKTLSHPYGATNFYQTSFASFKFTANSRGKIVIYRKNWNQIKTSNKELVQFDHFLNELVAHTYFMSLGKDDRLTAQFRSPQKTTLEDLSWPLTRLIFPTPYALYSNNFSGQEQCLNYEELYIYLDYLRRNKANWREYLSKTSPEHISDLPHSPQLIDKLKKKILSYDYNDFNKIFRPDNTEEKTSERARNFFYDVWRDINFHLLKTSPEIKNGDSPFEQKIFMRDLEVWFANKELPSERQASFNSKFYSQLGGYLCRLSCDTNKKCPDIMWSSDRGAP